MTTMLAVIGSLEVLQFTKTLLAPINLLGNSSEKECLPLTHTNFGVCETSDRSLQDNCSEPMELGRWIAEVVAADFCIAFPDRFERW